MDDRMKIMINGYARHGKDAVADILTSYNFRKKDASMIVARDIVLHALPKNYYGYGCLEDQIMMCYLDRVKRREWWYEYVRNFGPDKLTIECLTGGDLRVGIRRRSEFEAVKELFDLTIWVDAKGRLGEENLEPWLDIGPGDHDIVIQNNGDLNDLRHAVECVMRSVLTE